MSDAERYLLDTHVFIWWITDSPKLSKKASDVIASSANRILLSSISGWEISIKAQLGRIAEVGDPVLSVPFHAKRNSFEIIDFSLEDALSVYNLEQVHQDPFDRALISQARNLQVPIISGDRIFERYPIELVW